MSESFEIEKVPLHGKSKTISNMTPSNATFLIVLMVSCLVSINNYFCYHEPSAIANGFEDYYGIDTKQFGTLFTIYSAPNTVLAFFSGQFIDSYGLRKSSIFFNVLILVSMLLAALTPTPESGILSPTGVYVMLLLSRLLLGLGGESICACVSTMISRWFSSTQHANTAMALNQASVQLFGSAASFYILPHIKSIPACQWITVLVCVVSLVANIIYNYYETQHEDYLTEVNEKKDEEQYLHNELPSLPTYQSIDTDSVHDVSQNQHHKNIPTMQLPVEQSVWQQSVDTLAKFPVLFWLIILHISLVSPILYTFTAFGPMYLQETFGSSLTTTEAGTAISLLYMSIVAAPFTGMAIDYIGYRSWVQFFASANIPIIFLLLIYEVLDPSICMIWMGLIFSVTESNGVVLVSLVVPTELTGTAFGIYACCISFALLLEPATVGWIRQSTGSFSLSIWIFFSLTLAGTLVALYVVAYDRARHGIVSGASKRA